MWSSDWKRHAWGVNPAAATYYVDPLDGNDANAGTSLATAWKTIAKAEQVVLTAGQSIVKKVGGEFVTYKAYSSLAAQGYVYAYYQTAGNQPNAIPLASIDWSVLNIISHDHIEPNVDGSLNTAYMGMTPFYIAPLIAAAHANGVKVLVNIADIHYEQGGTGSGLTYEPNTPSQDPFLLISQSPALISTFVANLVNFILTNGYDGIEIDWEYGLTSIGLYALMAVLYPAIKAQNPNLLVNLALGNGSSMLASQMLNFCDTYTIECYDLFLSAGEVTWFNSALYGGLAWSQYGQALPSDASIVASFLQLGVPRNRVRLGIPFYGHLYQNPNFYGAAPQYAGEFIPLTPRQPYTPNYLIDNYWPYNYNASVYQPAYDQWDDLAQSPYMGIPGASPSGDQNQYLTYDDAASITAKCGWARSENLLGIAIWELSLDYFPTRTIVSPLLNTVKISYQKLAFPTVTPLAPSGLTAANLTASSLTLRWHQAATAASYIIQRSTTSGSGYVTIGTSIAPNYADTGLTSGTTYYYVVLSVNVTQSAASTQLAVTTGAGLPAAPASLTITASGPTATYPLFGTTLTWGSVGAAASYNVYRSTTNGTLYNLVGNTTALTFTDPTLTRNAAWFYVVTAVTSAGLESAFSNQVTYTTPTVYTSPNLLASPNAINVAPWIVYGTGAAATSPTTISAATSGDTDLTQTFSVTANTDCVASATVTAPYTGWVAFAIYNASWVLLGNGGGGVTAGVPTLLSTPFNTQTNTSVFVWFDFGAATGTITVTGASVTADVVAGAGYLAIQTNLVTSPSSLESAAWSLGTGTLLGPGSVQCTATPDAGKNVLSLTQYGIAVTPNTYYLATISVVRTDSTAFVLGAGGYLALSVGTGISVEPLSPGVVTDLYCLFNSGSSTVVSFSLYVTGNTAELAVLAITNISLCFNPYGGLT